MAHFLRDQFIKNVTVNENIIKQIFEQFLNRLNTLNHGLLDDDNGMSKKAVFFSIRYLKQV